MVGSISCIARSTDGSTASGSPFVRNSTCNVSGTPTPCVYGKYAIARGSSSTPLYLLSLATPTIVDGCFFGFPSRCPMGSVCGNSLFTNV
jgi:hypothetical protein